MQSSALHNAWSPILAGIFAGNAVVLKCSEQVIWSSTWYIEIIQNCLRACGHDSDLVQVCSSSHQQFSELILSLDCGMLTDWSRRFDYFSIHQAHHIHRFRGNWTKGSFVVFNRWNSLFNEVFQVAIAATKHLTPVTLELGGKDPAVILPNTDLNKWSSIWMRGVLWVTKFTC